MASFTVAVIAQYRWHKGGFIIINAGVAKHLIHRFNSVAGHHGGGTHLIHLQDSRRIAGAPGGDAGRQFLREAPLYTGTMR